MKLKRKVYETRREKRIDFFAGFFGCYIVNVVIGSIVAPALSGPSDTTGYILLGLILAMNAIAIVLLALSRTWIALGALAAYGAGFLFALVATALIFAACSGSF